MYTDKHTDRNDKVRKMTGTNSGEKKNNNKNWVVSPADNRKVSESFKQMHYINRKITHSKKKKKNTTETTDVNTNN